MALESQRNGDPESGSTELRLADSIRAIAAKNARADLTDDSQLLLFLKSWWSRQYNRPLKDPLLESYTLAELLYEFYDKVERIAAEKERLANEEIQVEVDKEKENLDWAEEMERAELEQLKNKAAKQEAAPAVDPTKDPENIKWMEEQMRIAKEQYGETFGEDIEETFE
jgi:hypothetical protein